MCVYLHYYIPADRLMETCLALSAASLHYGCKNPGPVVTRRNIKSGHHPVPQTGPRMINQKSQSSS